MLQSRHRELDQALGPTWMPSTHSLTFPQVSMASEALRSHAEVSKDSLKPSPSPAPTHGLWDVFVLGLSACHSGAMGSEVSPQTQDPASRPGVIQDGPNFWLPLDYPVEDITGIGITMC